MSPFIIKQNNVDYEEMVYYLYICLSRGAILFRPIFWQSRFLALLHGLLSLEDNILKGQGHSNSIPSYSTQLQINDIILIFAFNTASHFFQNGLFVQCTYYTLQLLKLVKINGWYLEYTSINCIPNIFLMIYCLHLNRYQCFWTCMYWLHLMSRVPNFLKQTILNCYTFKDCMLILLKLGKYIILSWIHWEFNAL